MEAETKEYIRDMLQTRRGTDVSYLSMTTITSTFKINKTIDVQDLKRKMTETPFIVNVKGVKSHEWNIKENKFFNQVTAEFRDKFSKKSVKFFPNGSIHVTGCCDLVDCHRVMAQVKLCIQKYSGHDDILIYDFKVLMINANFSMNSMLNLSMVTKNSENAGCIVSFKPEIYSAVKIKFVPGPLMKRITASVFSSGCVLITGAKTLKEISASYKFLIGLLQDTCIKPHVPLKPAATSFIGISFETWEKHLLD